MIRLTRLTSIIAPLAATLGILTTCAAAVGVTAPSADAAPPVQKITVDGSQPGRTFDGFGALSAGASSRLLLDYPPAQRDQILDYLFKPDYGANLQILKVEIGGDTNSTDGAEPSHEREPGAVDCNRGYEWSLMEQAKQRNPHIALSALEWGVPNWVGAGGTTPWTDQNISYLLDWLGCASQHHLKINYLGGWNEHKLNADWFVKFRQALDSHGYGDVQLVAGDNGWEVAPAMEKDPAFNAAVSVVGVHYPCGWLSDAKTCPAPPDALEAQKLGKPLSAGEDGSQQYDNGSFALARQLNRQYVQEKMTSAINWSLISSWYSTLPYSGAGLMLADQPWSGGYKTAKSIWTVAQTTQFAQPGWRYIDSASGMLASGGSYVTLRSPHTGDYSTVVETTDATESQTARFTVGGGLSTGTVHVWATDLRSDNPARQFQHVADVDPHNGAFSATLEPGFVYTSSTTTGQHKGTATTPARAPQPVPFTQNFEHTAQGAAPTGFSDLNGAFQAEPCTGRKGTCLRQVVTQQPVPWYDGDSFPWATVFGDPQSWRNYTVRADALLKGAGDDAEVLGRIGALNNSVASGYHLKITASGQWTLFSEGFDPNSSRGVTDKNLASGTTAIGTGSWHRLSLSFHGSRITASVDGRQLAAVTDTSYVLGQAGLVVGPTQTGQFDNVSVTPTGPQDILPQDEMTATATSQHISFEAANAVDGSTGNTWESEFQPKAALPQSVTIDMGAVHKVGRLLYEPPQSVIDLGSNSGNWADGTITDYTVSTSSDGQHFNTAAQGAWSPDDSLKTATFPARDARYVRLQANAGTNGFATAAEIYLAQAD